MSTAYTDPFFSGALEISQEMDEKARRAVKVFRTLQPTLSAYARVLTKRPNVRVELAARDNGSTDGNRIFYRPPMALGDNTPHEKKLCDKRDENLTLLCMACNTRESVLFVIYHEIAHIAFDTFGAVSDEDKAQLVDKAIQEYGGKHAEVIREKVKRTPAYLKDSYMGLANVVSPFLPVVVNALEDARVNAELFKARKGTRVMFDAQLKHVFDEGVEQRNAEGQIVTIKWCDYPLNAQITLGTFCIAAGYDYTGWFAPEVEEALRDAELAELCQRTTTLRSMGAVYRLSFEVLNRLRDLGFCRMPDDPEPEPKPEPEENEDEQSDEADPGDGPPSEDADPADGDGGEESSEEEDGGGSGESDKGAEESEDSSAGDSPDDGSSSDENDGDESGDEAEGGTSDSDADDSPSGGDPSGGDEATEVDGTESPSDPATGDEESSTAEGSPAGTGEPSSDSSDQDEVDDDGSAEDSEDTPDTGTEGEGEGQDSGPGDVDATGELDSPGSDTGYEHCDDPSEDGQHREADDDSSDDDSADGDRDSDSGGTPEPQDLGDDDGDTGSSGDDQGSADGDADQSDAPEGQEGSEEPDVRDNDSDRREQDVLSEGQDEATSDSDLGDTVDTGADDGTGGTEVIEDSANDDKPIDYGSADEARAALIKLGDHEEKPKTAVEQAEEVALEVAIIQGMYFETPSRNIWGVREHRFGQSDDGEAWETDKYRTYGYSLHEMGVDGDFRVPEPVLGPALMRMRRAFTDNQRGKNTANLKNGKVNPRVLGKRAPFDDERLFRRKTQPGKKNYHVLIGGDISGSTFGTNLALEKRAIMAQAELCHRLGVGFSVYCHTGDYSMPEFGRSHGMSLEVYHIKDAHEPWTEAVRERLESIGPSSANLDGHSLEFYRKRLDEIVATDKIIMYYTDGKMPAENYQEELEILQREIRTCGQKGYTLMGVGIRTDSPVRHGLDTVQVDGDSDIIKVVEHLEKRLAV